MMLYDVASVEDRGSHWYVTNVFPHTLDPIERHEKLLNLSAVSSSIIKHAIEKGIEVRITKPLEYNEVMPHEIRLIEGDENDHNYARESAIKKARMVVTHDLASVSGYTFYSFMCLNNELCDKGFFITAENRESKYLEILETGNEELIQKLEDYLNTKDQIERVAALNKKFDHFRKLIGEEDDIEKIEGLTNKFLEDYYSTFF
ncbi:hypothetical protein [Halobacteriovorax sp. BALOs_7]|uniref:hypothetical protein n=1 Tax=unclassified Halobacteriovorax TaxID=2639665 RepID=UPI000EA094CD|nr:hypothetical protein [Halobacteriovorax sp. BALOs_7]